ncbi:MAG: hypothetical protein BGO41_10165 [Clostridiales bacterium 38-18]|nr:MAG: hypothetical protein BGO41_10165 [Clostridiales bacterium 38-18]
MKLNEKKRESYIVVIGCGRLGAMLANEISDRNNNVLIIDRDKNSFRKLSPAFGGISMMGEGTDYNILKEANVFDADQIIIVTNNDNANILIAQMIRDKNNLANIYIRLYDPERKEVLEGLSVEMVSPLLLSYDVINLKLNEVMQ